MPGITAGYMYAGPLEPAGGRQQDVRPRYLEPCGYREAQQDSPQANRDIGHTLLLHQRPRQDKGDGGGGCHFFNTVSLAHIIIVIFINLFISLAGVKLFWLCLRIQFRIWRTGSLS